MSTTNYLFTVVQFRRVYVETEPIMTYKNHFKYIFFRSKPNNKQVGHFLKNALIMHLVMSFLAFVLRESNIGGLPLMCYWVLVFKILSYNKCVLHQ